MAILHRAQLTPSKLDLIRPWLAQQTWAQPLHPDADRLGTYRFDDPDGEVGVETFILHNGDNPPLHTPYTYRGAPLDSAEQHLIGTMQHSVLGPRWMYDATGDPVYAQTLASTILSGATEVEQYRETDTGKEIVPGTAHVKGSGNQPTTLDLPRELTTTTHNGITTITTDTHQLHIVRRIGDPLPDSISSTITHTLTGTWQGHDTPVVLAALSPR